MLLKEIMDLNYTGRKLIGQINFVYDDRKTKVTTKHLKDKDIKPTMAEITRYLEQCLVVPLDQLPIPEHTVVLRSGKPE